GLSLRKPISKSCPAAFQRRSHPVASLEAISAERRNGVPPWIAPAGRTPAALVSIGIPPSGFMGPRSPAASSLHDDELGPSLHRGPLLDENLLYRTVLGAAQFVFHLHRLDHHQALAFLDLLA